MKRMKSLAVLLFLMIISVHVIFPDARECALLLTLTGTVEKVNLDDAKAPQIDLVWKTSDGGTIRETLKIFFKTSSSGCIDWSDTKNRSKALVFGLNRGNVIKAAVRIVNAQKHVETLKLIGVSSATCFPGHEKITDQKLLEKFTVLQPSVDVMVLLTGHKELASAVSNKKNRDAARAKIKALQDAVIDNLPEGSFQTGLRLENVPSFSGTATLDGIKALAADPHVVAIEPDSVVKMDDTGTDAVQFPDKIGEKP